MQKLLSAFVFGTTCIALVVSPAQAQVELPKLPENQPKIIVRSPSEVPGGVIGGPKQDTGRAPIPPTDDSALNGVLGKIFGEGDLNYFEAVVDMQNRAEAYRQSGLNPEQLELASSIGSNPLVRDLQANPGEDLSLTGSVDVKQTTVVKTLEDASANLVGSHIQNAEALAMQTAALRPLSTAAFVEPLMAPLVSQANNYALATSAASLQQLQYSAQTSGGQPDQDFMANCVSSFNGLGLTNAYDTCAAQFSSNNQALGLALSANQIGKSLGGKLAGVFGANGANGTGTTTGTTPKNGKDPVTGAIGGILGRVGVGGAAGNAAAGVLGSTIAKGLTSNPSVASLVSSNLQGGALGYTNNPKLAVALACISPNAKGEYSVTDAFYGMANRTGLSTDILGRLKSVINDLGSGFVGGITGAVTGAAAKGGIAGSALDGLAGLTSGLVTKGGVKERIKGGQAADCANAKPDEILLAAAKDSKELFGDCLFKLQNVPNQTSSSIVETTQCYSGMGMGKMLVRQFWTNYQAFIRLFTEYCKLDEENYNNAYGRGVFSGSAPVTVKNSRQKEVVEAFGALNNDLINVKARFDQFTTMLVDFEVLQKAALDPTKLARAPFCSGQIDPDLKFAKAYIEQMATGKKSTTPAGTAAGVAGAVLNNADDVPPTLVSIIAAISLFKAFDTALKAVEEAQYLITRMRLDPDELVMRGYTNVLGGVANPPMIEKMKSSQSRLVKAMDKLYTNQQNERALLANQPAKAIQERKDNGAPTGDAG